MPTIYLYADHSINHTLITSHKSCESAFYLREVVMSNQNEGGFSGVIGTDGNLNLEERVEALELALLQQSEAILTLSNRIGKSAECGDDVIFVDKLTAPPTKLRS
ncbi:hypothetical protein [Proteus penneri]|nr:hypothetical protein [Proteus penneri]